MANVDAKPGREGTRLTSSSDRWRKLMPSDEDVRRGDLPLRLCANIVLKKRQLRNALGIQSTSNHEVVCKNFSYWFTQKSMPTVDPIVYFFTSIHIDHPVTIQYEIHLTPV